MARPLKYPQLADLRNAGDSVLVPANPDVKRKASQYAARKGFTVKLESFEDDFGVTYTKITRQ